MKKKIQIWVLAAILIICTVTMVFTSCTDNADNAVAEPEQPLSDKEMLMTLYGENKKTWANCAGRRQWTMLQMRVCTRLIIMRKVPIRGRISAKRPPFTFRARTACA